MVENNEVEMSVNTFFFTIPKLALCLTPHLSTNLYILNKLGFKFKITPKMIKIRNYYLQNINER